MPEYLGESHYEHGTAGRLAVLLVNLGTPDAPTPPAVRRFLAEFLWDARVIEAPRWWWWVALHGVILRIRPAKSAHAYQQIWTPQGSPLLVHSRALTAAVAARLKPRLAATVALGMTYGSPSIASALEQLRASGARRLLVLPLYPQYSGSTTGSVFDRVSTILQGWRWIPELRFVASYHDDPAYIAAIAASVREHWSVAGRTHLLFSFHGVPRSYLLAGDPYHCQCLKTARLVSEQLGLGAEDSSVSFQSQVGRQEWLRPYTDAWLLQSARQGSRRVTVVCPGFATDCLETLEEIAIRNRQAFLANGGEHFEYVPALNATDAHVSMLSDLIVRHVQGWPEAGGTASAAEATQTRQRALSRGAAR